MSASSWVRWLLAAAMLAVALYHLLRLVRARHRSALDLDLAHAAMGTTMASMLVGGPAERVLPGLFAGAACWFVVRTVRSYVLAGGGAVVAPAQAAVGCVAMTVMLAGFVGATGSSMDAMPTGAMTMSAVDYRPVGIALVVTTVALAGWTSARWWQQHRAGPTAGIALGCQLAMNVTTVAMLAIR